MLKIKCPNCGKTKTRKIDGFLESLDNGKLVYLSTYYCEKCKKYFEIRTDIQGVLNIRVIG